MPKKKKKKSDPRKQLIAVLHDGFFDNDDFLVWRECVPYRVGDDIETLKSRFAEKDAAKAEKVVGAIVLNMKSFDIFYCGKIERLNRHYKESFASASLGMIGQLPGYKDNPTTAVGLDSLTKKRLVNDKRSRSHKKVSADFPSLESLEKLSDSIASDQARRRRVQEIDEQD